MTVGLVGLFYLVQAAVAYAAARWDYAPLGNRSCSPRQMTWLVTIAGTFYLPLLLLIAPLLPLGDSFPELGMLDILLVGVALVLLAWPPLRGSFMKRLGLDPQRFLHGLLVYILLGELVRFAVSYLPYVMRGMTLPPVDGVIMAKVLLGQAWMLALALVAVGWGTKQRWQAVRQRLNLERRLGITAVGMALLGLAITLLSDQIVPNVVAQLLQKLSLVTMPVHSVLSGDSSLLWVLMGIVGAGVIEELFFRGLLQPRLGIFWTSLLFTMGHVQYPVAGLVGMFLTTLLWGWIAKRYGLRASILLHILNNLFFYGLSVSPAFVGLIGAAVPRAIVAAGLLWFAGYGIYRFAARRKAPFTPLTRPWLASLLGLFLLGGGLAGMMLMLSPGKTGWEAAYTAWAVGLGLLTLLIALPTVRRPLMRGLHLDSGRWAHLFAFYAFLFWAVQGLLWLCLGRSQRPWIFRHALGSLGEALTFSLFLGGLVLLGVGAGLWRNKQRAVVERLGFHRKLPWTAWCLPPAFASLLLVSGAAFCWLYEQLAGLMGGVALHLPQLDPVHLAAFAPLLAPLCLHACTEELLFRGALQPRVGLVAASCVGTLSGLAYLLRFYGLSFTALLLPLLLYAMASFALGWIARRYGLGISMLTSCLVYTGLFFACFL